MSVPADYVPGFVCHIGTCSVEEWGYVHYQPTLAGNILFLVIMAILGIAQLYLGIRHKTGLVCIMMCLGLLTETLGYIARVMLHQDPFFRDYFLWYLICLTIGPVFMAAAIYLCLGHIVVAYGESISRIRPRTYTLFFMGCDVVSLVVQAVGGGITASTPITNQSMIATGTNILVAGLSIQVASLFFFSACSLEFLWRARKFGNLRNPRFSDLCRSKRFQWFLRILMLATVFLFIRTVFRAVELSEGFRGDLANNEVLFMVLDGVMVILACTCLTVMHPAYGFTNRWSELKFPFRYPKAGSGRDVDQEDSPVAGTSSPVSEKINADVSAVS